MDYFLLGQYMDNMFFFLLRSKKIPHSYVYTHTYVHTSLGIQFTFSVASKRSQFANPLMPPIAAQFILA